MPNSSWLRWSKMSMAQNSHFIKHKLRPASLSEDRVAGQGPPMEPVSRLARHIITRPRLDDPVASLLADGSQIIAIWAAAGSGKRTLLRQWTAALTGHNVDVIHLEGRKLSDGTTSFAEQLQRTQSREATERQHVVIIHEAQTITTVTAQDNLLSTMKDLPSNVSVVITGRYQPAWCFALRQYPGVLTELRMADLAFDEGETVELAKRCGVSIEKSAVRSLLARTGGWAAAVVTVMRNAGAGAEHEAYRLVAQFLKHEVLTLLSAHERTVLSKTAIRPYIPDALANALVETPIASQILEQISQRIPFVTSQDGYFCFHPVLLEYFRFGASPSEKSAALRGHAIAAQWHFRRGEANQAVNEATLSRQPQMIEQTVDRYGLELMLSGDTAPVLRAVDIMTHDSAHPAAIATKLLGELPDFIDTLQVSHLFDLVVPDARTTCVVNSQWFAVVLALQCFQKDCRIPLADRLNRLRTPSVTRLRRKGFALNVFLTTAEAWGASRLGNTWQAQKLLRDVRISTQRAGYTWLQLLAIQLAIDIAHQVGDWYIAAACEEELHAVMTRSAKPVSDRVRATATIMVAQRTFRLCQRMPHDRLEAIHTDDDAMVGLDILARALRRFPELDAGENPRQTLESLDRLAGAHAAHHPQVFSIIALRLVDLALRLDGRQRATEIAERFAMALGPECLELKTIRFLLRRSTRAWDPTEVDLLAALNSTFRPRHRGLRAVAWHAGASIAAWLLLARAAERQGRHDEATVRVLDALRQAHHVRELQPFAAFDGDGAKLLASREGRFGPLEDFATQIRQRVTELHPLPLSSRVPKDPLTARELEILHELPLYQSVGDIACRKTVSVNTVKSHLRNIYQKLEATSRSEAVAKARRYGLLFSDTLLY